MAGEKNAWTETWLIDALDERGYKEFPLELYKFVAPNSAHFQLAMHELFLHSRLYMPSRLNFNDPFDSLVELHHMDLPEEARKERQGRIDRHGIASFSDRYHHPLMWAHYGASHSGIALVFGTQRLPSVMPMRYSDEPLPTQDTTRGGTDWRQLLTKGKCWEYEVEWRLVIKDTAGTYVHLRDDALIGVIFGLRCAEPTIHFIRDLCWRRKDAGLPDLVIGASGIKGTKVEFYKVDRTAPKSADSPSGLTPVSGKPLTDK